VRPVAECRCRGWPQPLRAGQPARPVRRWGIDPRRRVAEPLLLRLPALRARRGCAQRQQLLAGPGLPCLLGRAGQRAARAPSAGRVRPSLLASLLIAGWARPLPACRLPAMPAGRTRSVAPEPSPAANPSQWDFRAVDGHRFCRCWSLRWISGGRRRPQPAAGRQRGAARATDSSAQQAKPAAPANPTAPDAPAQPDADAWAREQSQAQAAASARKAGSRTATPPDAPAPRQRDPGTRRPGPRCTHGESAALRRTRPLAHPSTRAGPRRRARPAHDRGSRRPGPRCNRGDPTGRGRRSPRRRRSGSVVRPCLSYRVWKRFCAASRPLPTRASAASAQWSTLNASSLRSVAEKSRSTKSAGSIRPGGRPMPNRTRR